jgi:Wiskott-Aldrich syndrome protein
MEAHVNLIIWWLLFANDRFHVQIKFQSVKLARKYLERVSSELESIKVGPDEEELMLQGVRFAFRVHQVGVHTILCIIGHSKDQLNRIQTCCFVQFASGFDVDTMRAFQELKEKASMCHFQRQRQNRHLRQQILVARTWASLMSWRNHVPSCVMM